VSGADALQWLHLDEWLIAVDKPAGMLSVPGCGPDKADCMAARVQARWPEARVVHRLDMATSGLLVMARGADAQRRLSAAFERREVDKRYVAIVDGCLPDDAGEIAAPLAADWPRRPLQKVDLEHGRPSLTRWRVLERDRAAGCTRLELEPVTGRSHQLRVHLAHVGHPILGDLLYAPAALQARAPRLMLHAAAIVLPHPAAQGERLRLACPAPF
jgi:tRNA pseudouridine32 synthase/23S rRNA pseudouridine746 synthase